MTLSMMILTAGCNFVYINGDHCYVYVKYVIMSRATGDNIVDNHIRGTYPKLQWSIFTMAHLVYP